MVNNSFSTVFIRREVNSDEVKRQATEKKETKSVEKLENQLEKALLPRPKSRNMLFEIAFTSQTAFFHLLENQR